eukprot:Lithocolla_globosa_v1_NODE_250_length_4845_cov_7.523591.p1 type:complete len:751 gc:universal NODE_250_length_4845_cov_7.523591:3175-923(-)
MEVVTHGVESCAWLTGLTPTQSNALCDLQLDLTKLYGKRDLKDSFPSQYLSLIADRKMLIRFCKFYEWQTDVAKQKILESLRWKKSFGVLEIEDNDLPHDLLERGLFYYNLHKDKVGRRVAIFRIERHNMFEVDFEVLKKFLVYQLELGRRLSELDTNFDSMCTLVFDMLGFSTQNADLRLMKFFFSTLRYYYPCSIATVLVYRSPWMFSTFWNSVKAFLSPDLANQVYFVSSPAELSDWLNLDKLPIELGGCEPNPPHPLCPTMYYPQLREEEEKEGVEEKETEELEEKEIEEADQEKEVKEEKDIGQKPKEEPAVIALKCLQKGLYPAIQEMKKNASNVYIRTFTDGWFHGPLTSMTNQELTDTQLFNALEGIEEMLANERIIMLVNLSYFGACWEFIALTSAGIRWCTKKSTPTSAFIPYSEFPDHHFRGSPKKEFIKILTRLSVMQKKGASLVPDYSDSETEDGLEETFITESPVKVDSNAPKEIPNDDDEPDFSLFQGEEKQEEDPKKQTTPTPPSPAIKKQVTKSKDKSPPTPAKSTSVRLELMDGKTYQQESYCDHMRVCCDSEVALPLGRLLLDIAFTIDPPDSSFFYSSVLSCILNNITECVSPCVYVRVGDKKEKGENVMFVNETGQILQSNKLRKLRENTNISSTEKIFLLQEKACARDVWEGLVFTEKGVYWASTYSVPERYFCSYQRLVNFAWVEIRNGALILHDDLQGRYLTVQLRDKLQPFQKLFEEMLSLGEHQ